MNLDRIAGDGVEVLEHLRRSLNKKKIVVLGHSWGSTVAVHMVQRRPGLFAAYVGTGQVASWAAAVQTQFDLLLAKARADKDEGSIKMLEGNEPSCDRDTYPGANVLQPARRAVARRTRRLWPCM